MLGIEFRLPTEIMTAQDMLKYNKPIQAFEIPPRERQNASFEKVNQYNTKIISALREDYLGNQIDIFI